MIEELSANRSVQALTMSIGNWGSGRSLDHFHAHVLDRSIDSRREGVSAIMDQLFVAVFPGERLPNLLNRPVSGRMGGDVGVKNPAVPDLHHDEDIEHLEPKRHRSEEVASSDRLAMVAKERLPALAIDLSSVVRRPGGHVLGHGSRRHSYSDLQEKLRGDSFLSPSGVLPCHSEDDLLKILRYR